MRIYKEQLGPDHDEHDGANERRHDPKYICKQPQEKASKQTHSGNTQRLDQPSAQPELGSRECDVAENRNTTHNATSNRGKNKEHSAPKRNLMKVLHVNSLMYEKRPPWPPHNFFIPRFYYFG